MDDLSTGNLIVLSCAPAALRQNQRLIIIQPFEKRSGLIFERFWE
jgi:hypothetical protein